MSVLAEHVTEARKIVDHLLLMCPNEFRVVFLDNWREVRLVFDTKSSRQCDNLCYKCMNYRMFANGSLPSQEKLQTNLFEFKTPTDKFLYGPERYLPCKSLHRFVRCYVRCILFADECKTEVGLINELELVKNFLVVWSIGLDENGVKQFGDLLRLQIVSESLAGADPEHRQLLLSCLQKTGWSHDERRFF